MRIIFFEDNKMNLKTFFKLITFIITILTIYSCTALQRLSSNDLSNQFARKIKLVPKSHLSRE